jgi:capsular polysaccharide biosynthesis protein
MDLFAALVALGRRWYLTIALLIVLLAGTYVAASATKPEYKAEAKVIVLAPGQGSAEVPTNQGTINPYLNAGPAVFANVLSLVMSSDSTKQQIVKAGGSSDYTVGQGASSNQPIINIEATSPNPTVASRTAALLIASINHEAVQKQQQKLVPTSAYITTSTVVTGDKPAKLQGSRTRVTVAVGAMGGVLTFAAVLLIDNFLNARRTKQRRDKGGRRGDENAAGSGGPAGTGSGGDGAATGQSPSAEEIPLVRVRP